MKLGPKNDSDILQFYVTIVENKETTRVLCELTLDHNHGHIGHNAASISMVRVT